MTTPKKRGRPRKNPLPDPIEEIITADPLLGTVIPPEPPRPPVIEVEMVNATNQQLMEAIVELAKRRAEALELYEPLPNQVDFHNSRAPERILRGSVRAGKTLPAAVEVARAVTGRDPYGKYPMRDGRFYIVGPDEGHLADVIYKKLCRSGPFKIIRDKATGLWRSWRPWEPEDQERQKESKQAPPLISPRFIKEIAWSDKKRGVPKVIKLTSGWEITFFTANSTPQKGVDVDGVWFDEEISSEFWYSEMSARLLDREGCFIWSAAPQTGTQELYEIHKRAMAQLDLPRSERTAEEFHMKLSVNPFIKESQKQRLAEKLTADEIRVMIDGEYAYLSYLVWPEFSQTIHGIPSFEVPPSWSHYMLVDSGRQICGTLFFAIPPDDHELKGKKICFDELYIKGSSAAIWAESAAPKIRGRNYICFIIDHQGARQTEIGSGKTIEEQYTEALQAHGVTSRYGDGFQWGSTDVTGRISKFRSWLEHKETGPTFYYFKDICSNLPWEFERYHNAKVKGELIDKPLKKNDHLMDLCGYAAMHGLPYEAPPTPEKYGGNGRSFIQQWIHKNKQGNANFISLG